MHSGLDEPATLRHRVDRPAERQRGGARRARGARRRPGRLRPLAQGDGRHVDQRRAAHAGEELGAERRRRASRARARGRTLARDEQDGVARPRRRPRRVARGARGDARRRIAPPSRGSRRRIGRTDVAWRADSARVADTPLQDFVLEVMRRAAHADLAAGAVFSLDASLDSGRDHRRATAGALPVRQHGARDPHQRAAAARVSRAERALLRRRRDGRADGEPRDSRLQLRHRRRRGLRARRLASGRRARHAARGARAERSRRRTASPSR